MKTRKIIGGIVMAIGIIAAICTPDECKHELLYRTIGAMMAIAGGLLSDAFEAA